MTGRRTIFAAMLVCGIACLAITPAWAEPMFLGRQYARCTACHYSPTGGGLLTPYGRTLSKQELSLWRGGSAPPAASDPATAPPGEEGFLWGALGKKLGPVALGVEMMPSHLWYDSSGFSDSRGLFMTADLLGAVATKHWTVYGEIGRQPETAAKAATFDSYEHWIKYAGDNGWSVRGGRFLPAFGIRFSDHTSFNRANLTLGQYDQIYGVEVGKVTTRTLTQVTFGPGRAQSIVDDDGRAAWMMSGRTQFDVTSRQVVAVSGLYRAASDVEGGGGIFGGTYGLALSPRFTIWNEADVSVPADERPTRWALVNETSFEVFRGGWLKVSPQLLTSGDPLAGNTQRLAFSGVLLPRTHVNALLSYYRDRNSLSGAISTIWLAQLHLYL